MNGVERIQGTDGVRRQVKKTSEFNGNSHPLKLFLERGVMTEEFFELYCYAYVSDLIAGGEMKIGQEILIGWDPRDMERFYTSRAVSGISRAGGLPVILGTIPTPGVALMLVCRKSAGAIMITASHNPADQNGIKIFKPPYGMKMLPEDDVRLTRKIFDTDYEEIINIAPKYEPLHIEDTARKVFMDFHLDRRNSWIPDDDGGSSSIEIPFMDKILIVDPARGALSGIAADYFKQSGFGEVIEVAGEPDGRVNENSGVAFLEGVRAINSLSLQAEPGMARHELVKRMFEEGRKRKNNPAENVENSTKLWGAAFDADGDRFYILVYSAGEDTVYVLSGDETAALQAQYLEHIEPERYRGKFFIHTVESDINAGRYAASLGFTPLITEVGDKWILQKAVNDGKKFGIGCEETGHSIHCGTAVTMSGEEVEFYAGNGLKGAINTLVSMEMLGGSKQTGEFINWVKAPFEPGFKQSLYSYYISKHLFTGNSKTWGGTENIIYKTFDSSPANKMSLKNVMMDNEPDMLFLQIVHEDNGLLGTVFVRNSGTEDKISVNARGARELEKILSKILRETVLFLMQNMKDKTNPMGAAERLALETLHHGGQPEPGLFKTIDFDRLIFEMEIKQKLLKRKDGAFALTVLGRQLVD